MKQLEDSQLEAFDTEYVTDKLWKIVKEQIDKDFSEGDFNFLDIGGGNGKFADKLLNNYPKSMGTVLDNSELLLSKNNYNKRKKIVCNSVENLSKLDEKYDLICFNWLLHHLVGNSYSETRTNISTTLAAVTPLLTSRGRVSIFENMYNGLIIDGLPSYLIFNLTSNKTIATFTKRMGANTSGIGVCFLSQKQWFSTINKSHFKLLQYSNDDKWDIPIAWNTFLHIGHIRCSHFWLVTSC